MRLNKILSGLLVLCICSGWHSSAAAARAGNLYSAEVPVAERSSQEKRRAAAAALAMVMVKVSGDRRIAQDPAAGELLQNAEGLIQQFRYTPNSTMLVGFDGRGLQAQMRTAGLPVWNADRPATLVWLVVDYGAGERSIVSAADQGEVRTQIESVAAKRGLPLVWPLNDSIDLEAVSAADVWGGFSEKIDQASIRYGADAILIGRISRGSTGSFYGTWHLEAEGGQQDWRGGLNSSFHRVTDFFAERLASVTASDGPSAVVMHISGLGDGRAYAHAISSVEKLGTVSRVHVVRADGGSVTLQVVLDGDSDQLQRALSFSRVLVRDTESVNSGTPFQYRYAR